MIAFVPQSRDYGVASEELLWWQACRLQLTNAADTAASTVIKFVIRASSFTLCP